MKTETVQFDRTEAHRSALAMAAFYTKSHPELQAPISDIADKGFIALAKGDFLAGQQAFEEAFGLISKANGSTFNIPGCTHTDAVKTLAYLEKVLGTASGSSARGIRELDAVADPDGEGARQA